MQPHVAFEPGMLAGPHPGQTPQEGIEEDVDALSAGWRCRTPSPERTYCPSGQAPLTCGFLVAVPMSPVSPEAPTSPPPWQSTSRGSWAGYEGQQKQQSLLEPLSQAAFSGCLVTQDEGCHEIFQLPARAPSLRPDIVRAGSGAMTPSTETGSHAGELSPRSSIYDSVAGGYEESRSSKSSAAGSAGAWSDGSAGHPHACAGPCKYHWRRGCKLGESCPRCHLCIWSRAQERALACRRKLQ
mmetsp:Transcript_103335/g.287672  ORF Transcript_103335/g.287672 Transcript_103335/m.287672 type:complete len:241 (+) Transcript_103335:40-762(+)